MFAYVDTVLHDECRYEKSDKLIHRDFNFLNRLITLQWDDMMNRRYLQTTEDNDIVV